VCRKEKENFEVDIWGGKKKKAGWGETLRTRKEVVTNDNLPSLSEKKQDHRGDHGYKGADLGTDSESGEKATRVAEINKRGRSR